MVNSKSGCDGVGGNLKTLAHDYSLKHGEISNAEEFFNFVKSQKTACGDSYKTIPVLVTPEEIAATLEKYQDRWNMAKPIDGTQSFHDYRCDESNDRYLFVRKISNAEEYQRVCVYKKGK